jgi:hypothetical protein
MRLDFIFIIGLGLAAPSAFAHAGTMSCYDDGRTVEVSAKVGKNNGGANDVRIKSGDKTRVVKKQDISRMRTNEADFYMLFTVQTKTGPEELELDTHYTKKGGERKASAGYLTNKTEKSERLPVVCKFT